LEELDLLGTTVTGRGFSSPLAFPKLTSLGLEDTKVDDAGLTHLYHLKKLELVTLEGTHVPQEGVHALGRQFPDCYITSAPCPKKKTDCSVRKLRRPRPLILPDGKAAA